MNNSSPSSRPRAPRTPEWGAAAPARYMACAWYVNTAPTTLMLLYAAVHVVLKSDRCSHSVRLLTEQSSMALSNITICSFLWTTSVNRDQMRIEGIRIAAYSVGSLLLIQSLSCIRFIYRLVSDSVPGPVTQYTRNADDCTLTAVTTSSAITKWTGPDRLLVTTMLPAAAYLSLTVR